MESKVSILVELYKMALTYCTTTTTVYVFFLHQMSMQTVSATFVQRNCFSFYVYVYPYGVWLFNSTCVLFIYRLLNCLPLHSIIENTATFVVFLICNCCCESWCLEGVNKFSDEDEGLRSLCVIANQRFWILQFLYTRNKTHMSK